MQSLNNVFDQYQVVLEPDHDRTDWWAGAPSVVRDPDGIYWMAARMREGDSVRGQRGYEIRLLRSRDGVQFETVHRLKREDVPIRGFERPALLLDPETGRFKLYCCGTFDGEGYRPWVVVRFDDADAPSGFDPATCRTVLEPDLSRETVHSNTFNIFKDPFILHDGTRFHMYLIGMDRIERAMHMTSDDGENWERADPWIAVDVGHWHTFYTRPACVLPLAGGYLMVYEGSHPLWFDPPYNIATGLAFGEDLNRFHDLTPEGPVMTSSTPGRYQTWRYSHWLHVGDELKIYCEASRPNDSNEIRLFTIDAKAFTEELTSRMERLAIRG